MIWWQPNSPANEPLPIKTACHTSKNKSKIKNLILVNWFLYENYLFVLGTFLDVPFFFQMFSNVLHMWTWKEHRKNCEEHEENMKNMAPKLVNLRNSEHQEHEEHLKVKIEHRKMFPQMFIMYLFGKINFW